MSNKAVLFALRAFSAILILWFIGSAVSESLRDSRNTGKAKLAARIMPGDALNHFKAGTVSHYDLFGSDMQSAIAHYETAVRENPLYAQAWFHLARAYQAVDRADESIKAIENFYRLSPQNPGRAWDSGVFLLVESGRIERAMEYFRKYIELEPRSQEHVYDIASQMDIPNRYVIEGLLSGDSSRYTRYLKYLMRQERIERVLDFWNRIDHDLIDAQKRVSFCDFLLRIKHYDQASALWKEMTESEEKDETPFTDLLFNGSFEKDTKGGCFDWMIGRAEGAEVYFDGSVHMGGHRSLGISFDGEHNLNIAVARQHVLLEPGDYVLSANIKTEDMTTTNGLFFEAKGHDCGGFHSASEVVTGTTLWRTLNMNFSVPEGCRYVDISLRRQKSRKLNNKIGGNAWVDEVELRKNDS